MKVTSFIPSLGTTVCGIREYAQQMNNALRKYIDVYEIGNRDIFSWTSLIPGDTQLVHFQHEFLFCSLERLALFSKHCRQQGIKFGVTLHTWQRKMIDNYIRLVSEVDFVIVTLPSIYQELYDATIERKKISYIPLHIPEIIPVEITTDFDDKPLRIGFFGIASWHKNLLELIKVFAETIKPHYPQAFLLIITHASEHNPESRNIIDTAISLAENTYRLSYSDIHFIFDWLSDTELISLLRKMHLIVLPYRHYGSCGSSAAIRTALASERPVLVSRLPDFFVEFLDWPLLWIENGLSQDMLAAVNKVCSGQYEFSILRPYLEPMRIENTTKQLLEVYNNAINN